MSAFPTSVFSHEGCAPEQSKSDERPAPETALLDIKTKSVGDCAVACEIFLSMTLEVPVSPLFSSKPRIADVR